MKPRDVQLAAPDLVRIEWDGDRSVDLGARELRLACPCAACVHEWTRERLLEPDRVAADLTILGMEPVGRYAVTFMFADGHSTGIFTWEHLHRLCFPDAD